MSPAVSDTGACMRLPADRSGPRRPRGARPAAGRQRRNARPADAPVRPLGPAEHARVCQYTRMAYWLAWRFARERARDVPREELIAEALYGLTDAAGRYDETRRVPFGAYATMVIRHRLLIGVRDWRRGRRIPPLSAVLRRDESWEALEDRRAPPDLAAEAAARELCERVRRVLPARWYAVLHWYHADGQTLQQIGDRLGVTRERVRQLLVKAAAKARRHFADDAGEP